MGSNPTRLAALGYDLGGKLTGIDATGTANDATFSFDALGRTWKRNLTGSTDTYSFVGSTETVARISNSSGPVVTDSIVDVAGDRLGVKQGSTVNWFLPDPHGDIAASLSSTETTVVNAIRYDAYGQTIATGSAGGTAVGQANWKYQGRRSGPWRRRARFSGLDGESLCVRHKFKAPLPDRKLFLPQLTTNPLCRAPIFPL